METLTVRLSRRSVIGKKVKQLRRGGVVPVHLYGKGTKPLPLQIDAGVLRRLVPRAGMNIPISVEVEGADGQNICFVREVQRHPVTDNLLHVDFLRVDISQTISAEVPVLMIGEAPAVPNMGGTLLQPLQTVTVQALPMNMPASFSVDVSSLDDFEKTLRVSDLEVGADVSVLSDPDAMIARVVAPRIEEPEVTEEELLEAEEAEESEEGEEGEEGEAAPTEAGEDAGRRAGDRSQRTASKR